MIGIALFPRPSLQTQYGPAGELSAASEYRGSHLMTFAGYHAGRGGSSMDQAVRRSRDPKGPFDWVRRIRSPETPNTSQRVMEIWRYIGVGSRRPPPEKRHGRSKPPRRLAQLRPAAAPNAPVCHVGVPLT